jgi:hypothetical protein
MPMFPLGGFFQPLGASPFTVRSNLTIGTGYQLLIPAGSVSVPGLGIVGATATGIYYTGGGFSIAHGGSHAASMFATSHLFTGALAASGDLDANGGFRQTMADCSLDIAANTTQTLTRNRTGGDDDGWNVMSRAGSVVELAVWISADRTAGTAGFWVQKSTDGGDTWADLWGTAAAVVCEINGTDTERDVATQAKDTSTFAAGDILRTRCVQSVGFAGPVRLHSILTVEH